MNKSLVLLATVALAACRVEDQAPTNQATTNTTAPGVELSVTRLDCGHAEFKDMNGFFSDTPGVYPPGPGRVTDSCYLIRHGDQQMVWDTGFAAETKGKPLERGPMTAGIDRTLAEQLTSLA